MKTQNESIKTCISLIFYKHKSIMRKAEGLFIGRVCLFLTLTNNKEALAWSQGKFLAIHTRNINI
ncbi:MAG: hypothetical protein WCF65_10065, partial [Parachlamydiaceae bacterium]